MSRTFRVCQVSTWLHYTFDIAVQRVSVRLSVTVAANRRHSTCTLCSTTPLKTKQPPPCTSFYLPSTEGVVTLTARRRKLVGAHPPCTPLLHREASCLRGKVPRRSSRPLLGDLCRRPRHPRRVHPKNRRRSHLSWRCWQRRYPLLRLRC